MISTSNGCRRKENSSVSIFICKNTGGQMARGFAKALYNSKEWGEVREYCLKRDRYLCVRCGDPAEEVHHKIHLNPKNIYDISISLNPDNLESLCRECHFEQHRGEHASGRKKQEEIAESKYEFDENGYLIEVK